MNHKFNKFDRCEYCGIIKTSASANQACVYAEPDDGDGIVDILVSAATMATFTSLFDSSSSDTSSDDFSAGGGDFGGGGSSSDF